ncbi:hypothetical protein [Arthrobacter sunyaminii]|uniref:Uncharacterized protein n=1 Tax=Arthrobacter sunyaminii TaxID=2816859 RepID=A0A975S7Z2_9MICC|nr:hypothetical protein [Arthrobacter sunyaminii]MBO0906688.1 hypothetical protein [Arthrobacter sunyaminii]QWQ37465.1 hypothetical protein KG104_06960 [Arthrobacter sunyaminii]
MVLEILVPILMGALLKGADKFSEGVLSAVEETAEKGAASVFARLKAWWSSDKSAAEDLGKFEEEPDIYAPVIEARLVKKLTAEPQRQAEFAAIFETMGSQIEVFQTIARAHGITGAKVEELLRGSVNVHQRIDDASDVVGVDVKKMGA